MRIIAGIFITSLTFKNNIKNDSSFQSMLLNIFLKLNRAMLLVIIVDHAETSVFWLPVSIILLRKT
jgi:hypothetical protein